jgi:sarcosine oxidase subunit gamma
VALADVSTQGSNRRTPLGLAYAGATNPRLIDWTATAGDGVHQIAGSSRIRLFDLTPYARFGLKGRGTCDWLRSVGCAPPDQINTLKQQPDSVIEIFRFGMEDVLVLPRPGASVAAFDALKSDWEKEARRPKGSNAWREEVWAWFHLCGDGLCDFMAKTCGVDLHPDRFAIRQIAQTRVTHLDCIVARTDRAATHGLDLFFDIASSEFVLRSLQELDIT